MLDEGYIKYQIDWQLAPQPAAHFIEQINTCRNQLYQMGLIGAYNNGIGFGNISQRLATPNGLFVVSGTQTGHLPQLNAQHYAIVTQYSIEKNWLQCAGAIKASSEALTHAALYALHPQINTVIHIHHLATWQQQLNKLPTTAAEVAYGTPAMATVIARLYHQTNLPQTKVLVMAGHTEGIISFGNNCPDALNLLIDCLIK